MNPNEDANISMELDTQNNNTDANDDDDDNDDKPFNPFEMPAGVLMKIKHVIFFPIYILFFFTVPDPRRAFFRRFPFYFLSFLMSAVYIGCITYILVWMVVVISDTLHVPDTVAGLTLLAAGSSVPEIVSGIIVTCKGKGGMAISNSIGSNVFDILMCLSLPWLVSCILNLEPVPIYSRGIFYSTAILLITVFLLCVCFLINRWRLNKTLGVILIFIWIISTVFCCLLEYDIFGPFSLPLCE